MSEYKYFGDFEDDTMRLAVNGYSDGTAFWVTPNNSNTPTFKVQTIHISCHSDSYHGKNHRYGGIIIYGRNGQSDWTTANGTHCKSGYLVIQDTDCQPTPQSKYPNEPGIVHGAIYRNTFGESCRANNLKVIGEGFSIEDGEFRVNSASLNQFDDGFHDNYKSMNPDMEKYVSKVVQYWKDAGSNFTQCQNHNIKDLH